MTLPVATLHGPLTDLAGTMLPNARITISLVTGVDGNAPGTITGGLIIDPVVLYSDAEGNFTTDAILNSAIGPAGTYYQVVLVSNIGTRIPFKIWLTQTGSYLISDPTIRLLAPIPPDWTPIVGPTGGIGPQGVPLQIAGHVANEAALPSSGALGALWITDDTGHAWTWITTGTPSWFDTGEIVGPGVESGGTTGQALIKASSTDYDTAWHTLTAPDVGAANVFNVRSYGAVGDGTTNDTTAIAAANTAAHVAGGVVFFPPGTYKTSATFYVTKAEVSWKGAGSRASIIAPTNDGQICLDWNLTSHTDPLNAYEYVAGSIESLTFDGISATTGVGLHYVNVMNGVMRDVHWRSFRGTGGIGVWLENQNGKASEGTVWDNCLSSYNATGILFDVNQSNGTGNASFGYQDIRKLRITADGRSWGPQIGVCLKNGAYVYNAHLHIVGNIASATAIKVIGIGAVTYPTTLSGSFDIQIEAADASTTNFNVSQYGEVLGLGTVLFSAPYGVQAYTTDGTQKVLLGGNLSIPGYAGSSLAQIIGGPIEVTSAGGPNVTGIYAQGNKDLFLVGYGGTGSVHLRPQGSNATAGEAVVDATGKLTLAGPVAVGPWVASTAYVAGDVVQVSGALWRARNTHTSGTTFSGVTNWVSLDGPSVAPAGTATTLWTGTAAAYAALGTYDSGTVYVVTP